MLKPTTLSHNSVLIVGEIKHTIWLSNVLHNDKIQLVLGEARVHILDILALFRSSYCGHNRMTILEENIDDMSCNEPTSAYSSVSRRSCWPDVYSLPVTRARAILLATMAIA